MTFAEVLANAGGYFHFVKSEVLLFLYKLFLCLNNDTHNYIGWH